VSKQERRRRRQEQYDEELRQAIADGELLQEKGWCIAVVDGDLRFVVGGDIEEPRPEARHERFEATGAFNRLHELGGTDDGRDIARRAIDFVHSKGRINEL
jgi:hypothetical protein